MRPSLLALAAVLTACEPSINSKLDKIKPKLPADAFAFCDAARRSLAGAQASCLGAELQWTSQDPGLPTCDNWSRAAASGSARYDAVAAYDCLTLLGQLTCDDLVRFAAAVIPQACRQALQGQLTSQPCHDDVECAGGGYCDTSGNRCPGVCRVPASLPDADCSAQRCGPGYFCVNVDVTAVVLRCRALAIARPGDACGILATAGVAICTHGTFCDATRHCAAQRTAGACVAHDQCATGYRCAGSTATNRTCQPAVPLGGACTVGNDGCALGTTCVAGSCALYPKAGGACGAGAETVGCTGSTCVVPSGTVSGTCVAPFACLVP